MAETVGLDQELTRRRTATGEHRLPPAAAVVVAGAVYALLPESLLFAPRLVIPSVELALLIALVATNPRRMIRQTRWSRAASVALVSIIILAVRRREARRDQLPPADWRFSQDENDDAVIEVAVSASAKSGWIATFADYLYLSLTNSSAFSPTDTMPLTNRAKALMGIEATAALLTSLLVIARAVGSLGTGG